MYQTFDINTKINRIEEKFNFQRTEKIALESNKLSTLSQSDTSVTKERDKGASVKSSSRSKRSKDEDSAKERSKGDHVKTSSRSKHSNDEEPPSEKAPKEHREKPKERIKSSKSDRIKSSRTKDRSLTEHNVSRDESNDLQGN